MTNLMDDKERVGNSREHMFQTGITKSGIHPFLIIRKWPGFSSGENISCRCLFTKYRLCRIPFPLI
jgi:hypothetical protein